MKNIPTPYVDCYEVSEQGIRAVSVPFATFIHRWVNCTYAPDLDTARAIHMLNFREQKPRVAPRMSTASPSVAAA